MRSRPFRFVMFALAALAAVAVFGWVVMLLWNWIVPPVTGWHTVTYWQALGLLVLSKILFGGFRGASGRGRRWRRRWEKMTPEEREKFREAMRNRCGWSEPPPADSASPNVYSE